LRHPAPQRRPRRARRIVVGALGLPVLAGVYARAAGRSLVTRRPTVILAVLLTVSLAASLASDPMAAAPSSAYRPVRPEAFVPVAGAGLATPGTGPSGLAAARAPYLVSDPLDRRPAAARAEAPGVVRFRPRAGQDGIPPAAAVSVRFTVAMDRASTQGAFTATTGGSRIRGTYRWAEGDTVLVLTPARPMPYGARVTLVVTGDARSALGIALNGDVTAAFTVAPRPPSPTAAPSKAPAASGWRWPLIGPITQYFGQALTKYGYHYGIDIDGRTGDPVRAARTGTVVVAGHYDQCGGLEVHIDHGDGLVSWYRHLSRIDVRVGSKVSAGTVIGLVGETGCALGSHLHFAIRRGTTFVDPLRYLPPR